LNAYETKAITGSQPTLASPEFVVGATSFLQLHPAGSAIPSVRIDLSYSKEQQQQADGTKALKVPNVILQ